MNKLVCFFLLLISLGYAKAQEDSTIQEIEILHANDLIFDENAQVKAMRLVGDVKMKQKNTLLFCDSAYFYSNENSMKAFSNVRIEEGDSIKIFGDFAEYDGNKRFAKFRKNVRFEQSNTTLTTNYLDYDRTSNYAYYQGGGTIVNKAEETTLFSKVGFYYPSTQLFHFRDSVRMNSDDYKICADTLKYNREKDITYFVGPTIIWQDSTRIYCEGGYVDQPNDVAVFTKNAHIQDADQQLFGDSIFIDQAINKGEVFGNAIILDTADQFMVRGEYAENNQADSTTLVHGEAELIQFYSDGDSLFMHGDTLRSFYDTSGTKRLMTLYNKVKFYKSDLQGKCDSLVYSEADSLIKLYIDPIIWSEENQITATYIQIKSKEGEIDFMDMQHNAFICSMLDSLRYNQIKGDTMRGFFRENELDLVKVEGNGKTLYYAEEEDSTEIGINIAKSERLNIDIDSSAVKEIIFFTTPEARLVPAEDATALDKQLTGFIWRAYSRPKSRNDIFIWTEKDFIKPKPAIVEEQIEGGKRKQRTAD